MKKFILIITALIATSGINMAFAEETKANNINVNEKDARNAIKSGNKAFREGKYGEAETYYTEALQANPYSEIAQLNLALSLLRQTEVYAKRNEPYRPENKIIAGADTAFMQRSEGILTNLAHDSKNSAMKCNALFNLGNISFRRGENFEAINDKALQTNPSEAGPSLESSIEAYSSSIDFYKSLLRDNPDDNKARQNLRMAQIKLKQQKNKRQKNNDNKSGQQNQDQKQNQDQQQQQQQQNQNNQQDKKENPQQDQNKQNQQPQQQQQQQSPAQQKKEEKTQSQIDKILKAAERQEEQTRRKVEKNKEEKRGVRQRSTRPW